MKPLTEFGSRLITLHNGAQGLRGGLRTTIKEVAGESATMDFIASDESLDRYNELVKLDGWQLDNFRANPVIPDCHDYSSIARILGRAQSITVTDKQLVNRVEFCTDNPMGNLAYKMAKGGFINSQSVGFIPLEWENGLGAGKPDRTYTKQELLEVSLVVVPANPGATVGLALKSGAIVRTDLLAAIDSLTDLCSKDVPRSVVIRFKAGQKVQINPESKKLAEFPFSYVGTEAVGEVIATYTREGLMDVEFLGDRFGGMLRGVGFEHFVPADKEFCSDETVTGRHVGASVPGCYDAQYLQSAKVLRSTLVKVFGVLPEQLGLNQKP